VDSSVQFHVAVAPAAGSFTPADVQLGDPVDAGSVVGHVVTRQGAVDVVSAHTGVLVEWLADADDPVAPGAPLARLHPTGADR
jgi:[acyl-carrier-protein] S-malonyltransferase